MNDPSKYWNILDLIGQWQENRRGFKFYILKLTHSYYLCRRNVAFKPRFYFFAERLNIHSNSHAGFFCFNNIFVKRSKFVSSHKISQQGKSEFIFKFLLTCAFFKFSRAACNKSFTSLKIQIVYLIINQHYLSKIIINLKFVTQQIFLQ